VVGDWVEILGRFAGFRPESGLSGRDKSCRCARNQNKASFLPKKERIMNAINVIAPYRYLDMWVFDDPRVGLSAEPFVGGADTMIDQITAHLPNAEDGFVMVFSAYPFPGSDYRLEWLREERGGNVYHSADLEAEGWLCPALLRYFDGAPNEIYVQIKPKK
jgi:hypothetical protein